MQENNIIIKGILKFVLLCLTVLSYGQNTSPQHLYLLSNLESLTANAPEFDAIQDIIAQAKGDFTILVNGDFVDRDGLEKSPTQAEITKLDRLMALASDKGEIVFVPGDREWNNGAKNGLEKVKGLEKYLKAKLEKGAVVFPQKGCLGPAILDIGDHLRLVMINSQWFVQNQQRPEEEDTDCGLLNETEFWDELDDALTDSDNRNLVVVSHHPALSYGQYAGFKLLGQHFKPPIIGSILAAYHQNIGTTKDLSNEKLKHFSKNLLKKAEAHPGAIFVSGHEYDTQVLFKDGNYHLSSGAVAKAKAVAKGTATIYKNNKPSFTQLTFEKDGQVNLKIYSLRSIKMVQKTYEQLLFSSPCKIGKEKIPSNTSFNPCIEKITNIEESNATLRKTGTAIAGEQYAAGKVKQFFMGEHYRTIWATPIKDIPYLNVDTTDGGLTPYAIGGAAQTLSLKFKSKNGKRFAFRSVDKNPTKRKDKALVQGVYGKIVQDLTSTQNPYGPTIITSLMDVLDLPHSMPKLFLMPNSPKLGAYREQFAGKLGWLELKPKGKKKGKAGFRNADKVKSTLQMYRKLLEDNDNRIDVAAFVKARILDIWISDWDRHTNNWKWLAYKEENGYLYTPFPKDRDKALALLNGIFNVLDWEFVAPDMADFTKKYKGLKSLNYKNRSMDRWLANSYTYEDWMDAAKHIQQVMTDEVIEKAILSVPKEVQDISRKQISNVLRARRDHLPQVIHQYYGMLAKYIDLVGSNSRDFFALTRLSNGDVLAEQFKLNKKHEVGKKLYSRVLKKKETKEIRLHGLGKRDSFHISGQANKSILIRIIGGDGKDKIVDNSMVKGRKKMTLVYDKRNKDQLDLNTEAKKTTTPKVITFQSQDIFRDDQFLILPSLSFNQDDGFAIGFGGNFTKQKFNKPNFGEKYNFSGAITTKGHYSLNVDARYRHLLRQWDLVTGVNMADRDRTFRNFYGFGNETVLEEALNNQNFYQNNRRSFEFYIGLSRQFWHKSYFTTRLLLDFKDVQPNPKEKNAASIYDDLPPNNGLGTTTLLGPQVDLDLNFKDNDAFPTKGMEVKVRNYTFLNADLDWKVGGRLQSELSGFITRGIKIPVTLSLRTGFSLAYGDTPFYYKSYLGQQSNHRGYLRNRFGGDTAVFFNADLRFHFGTLITPLVPLKYGLFVLYDEGRVWVDNMEESDTFHTAIGGGIYIIPYIESFNLNFTVARSEQKEVLFSFNLGFFIH